VGLLIERLAINGDPSSFLLPKPLTKVKNCDFSFSGLKTAAIDIIKKNKIDKKFLNDFTASFQFTVGEISKTKSFFSLFGVP
jgi:N6-L-threonylcarbamoyladenine synthase